MAKSAIVSIRLVGDAESARKALNQTATAAEKFQAGINKAAGYASLGFAAISAASLSWIDSASEAEQAQGALAATFGDQTAAMQANAEAAAESVGLASSEYAQMSAVIGSQLKNLGVDQANLGAETDNLIRLGADLAAQFGGTTADAVGALGSLLRGERDPIERYGVSIKQATIDAKVAELGLDGLTGAAKTAAERQATLALLTEQTASAQGAFSRESDTAAGAQQRANAEFENAKAALGAGFLPAVSAAANWAKGFATWAKDNPQLVAGIVVALGTLALAIMGVAAVTTIMNATWLASPVTWITLGIVAAIGLVVAAIVWLTQNWDAAMAWLQKTGQDLANGWQGMWQDIGKWWQELWNGIGNNWASFWNDVGNNWSGFWRDVGNNWSNFWNDIVAGWQGMWRDIIDWLVDSWNNFASFWADIWNGMFGWVNDVAGHVNDALGWIGNLSVSTEATANINHAYTAAAYDAARPMTFYLAAFEPPRPLAASFANAAAPSARHATYNINVTGATDREAAAREIRDMIADLERSEGRRQW
ncbi:hypothetical protein [Gulosibacter bifidus]|uniref:Tape measure protein n=1 Tax=Gulosibacter bifidus TaxID=272239 RepID=A0ABW5RIT5_9MICO|nr:hypothetical protein [Gulosibacter bifidus]